MNLPRSLNRSNLQHSAALAKIEELEALLDDICQGETPPAVEKVETETPFVSPLDAMIAETLAAPEPTVAVPLDPASKPTLPPPSSLDLTVLSHAGLPPEVVQLLTQAIMITHQVQHPN